MASTETKPNLAAKDKTDDLAGLEAGLDALDAVQTHRTPTREVFVKKVLPPFLAITLVLVVWQVLVSLKVTDETKLPAPSAVWDSLSDMWLKGTLLDVVWTSVSRGLLGFLLALAIGTPSDSSSPASPSSAPPSAPSSKACNPCPRSPGSPRPSCGSASTTP